MRFVADECSGPALADWLREQGHDTVSVFEVARGASDANVLSRAYEQARILVTNDEDFGEMVFRERRPHRGIVLLRLEDERATSKIAAMRRLLADHADRVEGRFVVVTEGSVRFAAAP